MPRFDGRDDPDWSRVVRILTELVVDSQPTAQRRTVLNHGGEMLGTYRHEGVFFWICL
jgi:hypothetical protein